MRVSNRAAVGPGVWHIALLAFVWLWATAWMRPLTAPDETRYADVALHMLQSGDWLVPRLDGMPFFHKPPLFYWLCAVSMQVFGVNEWAARIPSVVGGTLAVASVYGFVRRRVEDGRVALFAALSLATMPYVYVGSQFTNLDMLVAGLLSTTVCVAADAVMLRLSGDPWQRTAMAAFALTALGVLAKGLIGVVLPFAIIVFWSVRSTTWRRLLPMFLFVRGWIVFLVIAMPWFVAMQARYPEFFDYFVITQHFRRFTQSGFNNSQPVWFFIPVILLFAAPWPAWLLTLWRRDIRVAVKWSAVDRFMLVWFATVLIFFSIPQSKLVGYVLPVLPPFAYFLGRIVVAVIDRKARAAKLLTWSFGFATALCIVATAALTFREDRTDGALIRRVAAKVSPVDRVVMIDSYHYEVPFYWHVTSQIKVAGDWSPLFATAHDNWRKELYDSGSFDLASKQRALISPTAVDRVICAPGKTWVLANPGEAMLRDVAPVAATHSLAIWQLSSSAARCAGLSGQTDSSDLPV